VGSGVPFAFDSTANLPRDVSRPSLHFKKDALHVLPHDAQAEQLDRTHQKDDDHSARPSLRGCTTKKIIDHDPHDGEQSQQSRANAEVYDEAQRNAAETDETFHRQAKNLSKSILRSARLTGRPLVDQPGLAKPDKGAQAAHEAGALLAGLQRLDHLPVHQAAIAAVEREVKIAYTA